MNHLRIQNKIIIIAFALILNSGCATTNPAMAYQKEIKISRDREELLAQAVKTLSYQVDILTDKYLEK